MINVLVMSPCTDDDKDFLRSAGSCFSFYFAGKETDNDKLKEEIDKAEIIIGEPEISMIADAPNLKLIQMTMAGNRPVHKGGRISPSCYACQRFRSFRRSHIAICHRSHFKTYIISFIFTGIIRKRNLWQDMGR